MKIAILHPQAKIKGGAIKMLLLIANELKKDHEVDFYTFSLDRKNCFEDLNEDLNMIDLNLKGFKKLFGLIKLAFKLRKYDIVFAGNSPMHFAGVLAKFFNKKIRVFWYLQNIPFYYLEENYSFFTTIKRFIEKNLIVPNVQIISNSNFISEKVKKYFNKNSFLLFPCIDTNFFKKQESVKEIFPSLFVNSRLVKGKNVELAINVFIKLNNKYPELKLFIAGDGEEKEKLENYYKERSHCSETIDGIIFLGEISQDEIRKYYTISTIFLFTSLIDAFGLTIVEAMSLGKPVVSLSVGGPKEIIVSGVNGFLADNDDDFIDKVELLLKNEQLRGEIGNKATEHIKERFSLETLNELLNKILF